MITGGTLDARLFSLARLVSPDRRNMKGTLVVLKRILGLLLLGGVFGALFNPLAFSQTKPVPSGLITGQAARFVLGQKNFSDISFCDNPPNNILSCPIPTRIRLGSISGIAIADNRLIVADSSYLQPPNNNRILIFNDLASLKTRNITELASADVVLGQPDFTTATLGVTASKMNQPVSVATDGTRLFVAEWGNNRVLIYNQIPTASGAAADLVIGQTNFTTSTAGTGLNKLTRPNSVATDGTRVIISDTLNNRVLLFNRLPSQNGASADISLGQANCGSGQTQPASAGTLCNPMSATSDGTRLIVTDMGNNRVLIYNSIPTQSGALPNVVLGQADFTGRNPGNTETSLNFPRHAYSDGTRLVISDSGNNRVLIYNQIPTQNGAAPNLVLGQADFFGLQEACAASNLTVPYHVVSDGETLFVSDSFNRRVLGYRPGPKLVELDGVVNSASYSSRPQTLACGVFLLQPPLAPGAIASIFGTGMANSTESAGALPLPKKLGGVKVKFNGIEAPIFYASPSQINVQVPFDLTGFSASLELEKDSPTGAIVSAAVPVGLANGAPAIFTLSQDGQGHGHIYHSDFRPVNDDAPAKQGETLVAFATGLGRVDQPLNAGDAALFGAMGSIAIAGAAPVNAEQTITVTIGNVSHSYIAAVGETLDVTAQRVADLIERNDPLVHATVNPTDITINLRSREVGSAGIGIPYSATVTEAGSLEGTGSLTATAGSATLLPGNITFEGNPTPNQTTTITIAGSSYAYVAVSGDTAASVVSALVRILKDDPVVNASVGSTATTLDLQLKQVVDDPTRTYSVDVTPGPRLQTQVEKTGAVPGSIRFAGAVTAGQVVTIDLSGSKFTYTTEASDTLVSVINAVTALINADPNVTATASVSDLRITLALRNANSGLFIPFSASVTAPPAFRAFAAYHRLQPGVASAVTSTRALVGSPAPLVPGDIFFGGTAEPDQIVTISLEDRKYSYTIAAGDTMQTVISRLTEQINNDADVTALADLANLKITLTLRNAAQNLKIKITSATVPAGNLIVLVQGTTDTIDVGVSFAGPTVGFAGLYQVNFTLPTDIAVNPKAALILRQTLVIFGSSTLFDIISNPAEFPIVAATP